jgi:drug/metabolite transporter (DMT)-like permease
MPDAAPNRTMAALGLILAYAAMVGWVDNYVRLIAADGGLWQFHATRSAMAIALAALAAPVLGFRFRPRNPRAVALRSLVHAGAILTYFGSLAFLPVAVAAAGLFTAPIFVALIGRFAYGHAVGALGWAAIAAGFAGAVLVVAPGGLGALSPAALLPVAAGALYGLANLATREWCAGETAMTLTLAFLLALGLFGAAGMAVLALWPLPVPAGAEGFLLRGPVLPTGTFLFWTAMQALVALVGVSLMVRAYQIAPAARVSVFEFALLPFSAAFGWAIWGDRIAPVAALGMALIALAGAVILLAPRRPAAARA